MGSRVSETGYTTLCLEKVGARNVSHQVVPKVGLVALAFLHYEGFANSSSQMKFELLYDAASLRQRRKNSFHTNDDILRIGLRKSLMGKTLSIVDH